MKKFTLAAVLLSMSLFASAQSKSVTISSINGTNVEQYNGQVAEVKMNRYMFTGWNTVSFPFDLSTDKINEFFGNDRVVDTHIRTIRNCLGVYRDLLVTQRNGGYKFEVPQ